MTSPARIINNHLVVQTENPGQLRAVLPEIKEATIKGHKVCAVPFSLETARVLNNLGIPSPSPIRTQYDWQGMYKPMAHQVHTAEFMTLHQRCFVLNGMGSAKTLSSLWAADYMQRTGQANKVLVVAPLSTLDPTWGNEIFRNFPLKRFAILHGSRQKRLDLLKTKQDIFIINHDGVEIIAEQLMERDDIDLIILDECFPAGTKVSTPAGERPIETLRLGDSVVCSWGVMPVTRIFKKKAKALVRLHMEDGTYVECTPDHPFATDQGWVRAAETEGRVCLRENELRILRRNIQKENLPSKIRSALLFARVLYERCCPQKNNSSVRALSGPLHSNRGVPEEQPREILLKHVRDTVSSQGETDDRKNLRILREKVQGRKSIIKIQAAKDMLKALRHEMGLGKQPQYAQRIRKDSEKIERAGGLEQRNADTPGNYCEKEEADRGRNSSIQKGPRGQWDRDDESRENSSTVSPAELQAQRSDLTRSQKKRLSYQLQSGLWGHREQDSRRSRWVEPQHDNSPRAGQEKRNEIRGIRVDRVENIEQCSSQWVWNIEVAGPHNYIAGGVVVHNCSMYRNQRTGRWKTMNKILNKCGFPRSAWGLTGAPTPNEPTDAFAQMKLIKPENYRGHFTTFKNETMHQLTQFKWIPRKGSEETVNRILKPSIRYALSDCVDLPETIYADRHVALSTEQHKHYRELLNQAMTEIQGSAVTAVNAAVLVSKIVQAACGVLYAADGSILKIDFGPRIALVKELVEACPQKVLVFVPLTGALKAVAAELAKKWTVATIDGSTSMTQRNKIFQEFRQTPNPHIIVANAAAMSHGLTLTEASSIIWYAPAFSNDVYNQANARIVRPGQKHVTHITHIYATAEERKIYNVLKEKGRMQDAVLDLAKEGR